MSLPPGRPRKSQRAWSPEWLQALPEADFELVCQLTKSQMMTQKGKLSAEDNDRLKALGAELHRRNKLKTK